VLIRGPSGSGKSRLAFDLIEAGRVGTLQFVRLVADDRVHLEAANGHLVARPAQVLAGLLELRGVGLLRFPFEPRAVIGLVIDLAADDAARLPDADRRRMEVEGIILPRLPVVTGDAALPMVFALLNPGDNHEELGAATV